MPESTKANLDFRVRALGSKLKLWAKRLPKSDRQRIDVYLRSHRVKKLHVGCGKNILGGWLNSDLEPFSARVVALDATATLPFGDGTFDFIFSEHMIEHVSYADARKMLSEFQRVLRPGGKIRISTPDLLFLIDLFRAEKSDRQERYIQWSADTFVPDAPCYRETFVLNNFMRNWEHKFIYDERVLRDALERAGFVEITRYGLNASGDEELRDLEIERRLPPGLLALETMVFEATKPVGTVPHG